MIPKLTIYTILINLCNNKIQYTAKKNNNQMQEYFFLRWKNVII